MRKPNSTYVECVSCVNKKKEPVLVAPVIIEEKTQIEEPKVDSPVKIKLVPAAPQHYYDDLTSSSENDEEEDHEITKKSVKPKEKERKNTTIGADTEQKFLEANESDLEVFKERIKIVTRFLASSYRKLDEITDNLEQIEANNKELGEVAENGKLLLQAIAAAETVYYS